MSSKKDSYIRYALDVNVERAEDVVMHQRLLLSALDPHNRRPAIQVRLVQVLFLSSFFLTCLLSSPHGK